MYTIYSHDLQDNWSATTSNDQRGQEKDSRVPHIGEEMQQVNHFLVSCVCEGLPHLMLHFRQIWETLQVHWDALAEISQSAIGQWQNPSKYPVTNLYMMSLNCCSDPGCHPTLTRNMLATIDAPSMLLKQLMKSIVPPWSSILYALTHPTKGKQGVHSASVF